MKPPYVETHATNECVYVIVRDRAAGRPKRFTTFKIELTCHEEVSVVGRELTLAHSRRIVKDEIGVSNG